MALTVSSVYNSRECKLEMPSKAGSGLLKQLMLTEYVVTVTAERADSKPGFHQGQHRYGWPRAGKFLSLGAASTQEPCVELHRLL